MYMCTAHHVLLLSWRAHATQHQLSCDLGRGTYHGRHVAGVAKYNAVDSMSVGFPIRNYVPRLQCRHSGNHIHSEVTPALVIYRSQLSRDSKNL